MDLSERGAFGMDDKQPGYYLTMQFSVLRGGSRWTTEAGPFASADEAIDATIGDRAVICIAPSGVILRVEDSGNPLQATSYRERVPLGAFDLPARPSAPVPSTSAPVPAP